MAYSYKDLCLLLDCKQAASLKRVMKQRGIRWRPDRRGRPWTTEEELQKAFGSEKREGITFTKPPVFPQARLNNRFKHLPKESQS